jgi:hypothetical protein
MPLGFNPTPESKIKHYRKYYDDELENNKNLIPYLPFDEYPIIRG